MAAVSLYLELWEIPRRFPGCADAGWLVFVAVGDPGYQPPSTKYLLADPSTLWNAFIKVSAAELKRRLVFMND